MMKEKKGYLIYFDLLGYKNIIAQKDKKTINQLKNFIDKHFTIHAVKNVVNLIKGDNFNIDKLVFRCYSDNFLIFYESLKDIDSLISSICLSSYYSSCAIINGFMIRGSIVYGDLSFNDNVVFGKSIIEAYELENAHNDPSVVLSADLKNIYEENELYKVDGLSPFLLYDKDDYFYGKKYYEGIKIMIDRLNHQSFVDERTIYKYKWLIAEYNRYFKDYCNITFDEQPSHFELFYNDTSENI